MNGTFLAIRRGACCSCFCDSFLLQVSVLSSSPGVFLRAAYDAGDIATARKWQARVNDFVRVITRPKFKGGVQATKVVFKIVTGLDVGPTRLPLEFLSDTTQAELEADLRAIGFFEWKDGDEVSA
jgi:dihydrodipicolinate synthase/N-acetylneuraminate lyase